MRDYSEYKQCKHCKKYDIPDEECQYTRNGYTRYDSSMQCDGVLTWDVNPFAAEIHDDFSKSWGCQGSRYESAQDI